MAGVTEKEKAKIMRHFLLNSPPGQFSFVEKDLRALVGADLVNRTLPMIAKRYNEEQFLIATVPDSDTKFLITKSGALSENEYFDPNTDSVITFDHIKRSSESKRSASAHEQTPAHIEPFRSKAQGLLDEYVTSFYPTASDAVYGAEQEGAIRISAYISATKANLTSKWAGRIRSEYTATFSAGESEVTIEGNLVATIHSFEEGNVQLNTTGSPSATCTASTPEEFAVSFVKVIETFENGFHKQLELAFGDLSENTFKQLRRKLPLNQSKFDFENWSQYEIGAELGKQ